MKEHLFILINAENVLSKAIELVVSARKNIIVTHSDADNSRVKPSSEYYSALRQTKAQITRYIFSSTSFEQYTSENILHIYGGRNNVYQRAIIIDGRRAMFKVGDEFYYSEYRPLVIVLIKKIKDTHAK